MEIAFKTDLQHHIADLLWNAQTTEKVRDVIRVYGKEAEVVFHMIMAHYYDQVDAVDLAQEVIGRVK